jgi:hypothetical protein
VSSMLKRTGATLLAIAALTAASMAALTVAPSASAAPKPLATAPSTLDLTGTLAGGGSFVGQLTSLQFVNQNGNLAVTGLLTGTLTNAAGTVLGSVTNLPITLPVAGAQAGGTCKILDLTLGPLDLNLLGLMVHLDTVHLEITAQQGPGNLLGNLLCGVAHLLDGGGGGGLANLLNRLLGL